MKVFLDSDVILDYLLDRQPFSNEIAQIIQLSVDGKFKLGVSSITITNLNYIIGRIETKQTAETKTKKILKLVRIENVGESTIHSAINSGFKDFEDGVQHFSAVEANHKTIITRNVKDYKTSEIAVFTPNEFLSSIFK